MPKDEKRLSRKELREDNIRLNDQFLYLQAALVSAQNFYSLECEKNFQLQKKIQEFQAEFQRLSSAFEKAEAQQKELRKEGDVDPLDFRELYADHESLVLQKDALEFELKKLQKEMSGLKDGFLHSMEEQVVDGVVTDSPIASTEASARSRETLRGILPPNYYETDLFEVETDFVPKTLGRLTKKRDEELPRGSYFESKEESQRRKKKDYGLKDESSRLSRTDVLVTEIPFASRKDVASQADSLEEDAISAANALFPESIDISGDSLFDLAFPAFDEARDRSESDKNKERIATQYENQHKLRVNSLEEKLQKNYKELEELKKLDFDKKSPLFLEERRLMANIKYEETALENLKKSFGYGDEGDYEALLAKYKKSQAELEDSKKRNKELQGLNEGYSMWNKNLNKKLKTTEAKLLELCNKKNASRRDPDSFYVSTAAAAEASAASAAAYPLYDQGQDRGGLQ